MASCNLIGSESRREFPVLPAVKRMSLIPLATRVLM